MLELLSALSGCSSDSDCLNNTAAFRCLQAPKGGGGSPCTLDYKYNETGLCACAAQACAPASASAADPSKKQYLVVGDSISQGYFGALGAALGSGWQLVHAPGNNGNANWASRCLQGWLGPDPLRWDAVSYNAGLHDLANPDNEHVALRDYARLLAAVLARLGRATKPNAALLWVDTTPVPTQPPAECVLIPRRVESDVLAYNAAAAGVVASAQAARAVRSCGVHQAVVDHCGAGYATCNISQCKGPHFTEPGFALIANKIASCVTQAVHEE